MGVIVLSAGVGNDVIGWILLALCVALVNSGAGLTALWILMVAVGYSLFLVFAVRPCVFWILRRTGSLANGPTQTVVALIVFLVLASAFFTGIIGIHPIFGAFMIGLLLPHEGGFAVKLTEKLEDLVSVLFLPLYFALSGLSTDLGLLNTGLTWGYVVGVCAIAFIGKVAGGTIASRLNGLVWRESFTIGVLMSCKGLVELIVLNIGLQAKILSTRTFTIFVVMALVTTFATTPLTAWLYPPWYQRKLELWKQGKIDWDGNVIHREDDSGETSQADILRKSDIAKRVLVYLRLDGLPSLFTLVSLFAHESDDAEVRPPSAAPQPQSESIMKHPQSSVLTLRRPVQVHGLRLMELTERESSVMRVAEIEEFASRDPVIKAFGTFGQSRNISVDGQIAVVPDYSFSGTLMNRARDLRSDLVLIPWSETGTMSEYPSLWDANPGDPLANKQFATLAAEMFEKVRHMCHAGVIIEKATMSEADPDRAESPVQERIPRLSRTPTGIMSLAEHVNSTVHFKLGDSGRYRLFVLYQGSEDDLFGVRLGLQLAKNEMVDLKIVNARLDEVDMIKQAGGASGDAQPPSSTTADADREFEMVRTSIADCLSDRVTITDLAMSGFEALSSAIAEPSAAETIIIVGRNTSIRDSSLSASASGSSRDESRALGARATTLVKAIRQRKFHTGLLIVQAKREEEEDVAAPAAPGSAAAFDPRGMPRLTKTISALSDE